MKKNSFSMIDEDGKEVVYDVLFTFESDETKKNYIVYTDNSRDEAGNIQVYALYMILKILIVSWKQLLQIKNGK